VGGAAGWDGWTSVGEAWCPTVRARPGDPYPSIPHTESAALKSPRVRLLGRGWDGRYGERGNVFLALVDAETGKRLRRSEPPLSDKPQWIEWVSPGKRLRSVERLNWPHQSAILQWSYG